VHPRGANWFWNQYKLASDLPGDPGGFFTHSCRVRSCRRSVRAPLALVAVSASRRWRAAVADTCEHAERTANQEIGGAILCVCPVQVFWWPRVTTDISSQRRMPLRVNDYTRGERQSTRRGQFPGMRRAATRHGVGAL
jgi:hypothetical protein